MPPLGEGDLVPADGAAPRQPRGACAFAPREVRAHQGLDLRVGVAESLEERAAVLALDEPARAVLVLRQAVSRPVEPPCADPPDDGASARLRLGDGLVVPCGRARLCHRRWRGREGAVELERLRLFVPHPPAHHPQVLVAEGHVVVALIPGFYAIHSDWIHNAVNIVICKSLTGGLLWIDVGAEKIFPDYLRY